MSYTLTYRTCRPVSPDEESAVRAAVDAFNVGREWVLALRHDERDGRLICHMENPADEQPMRWPGAYEAQRLLDGLCGISRQCQVDWEIRDPYGRRPIGVIRAGECHSDAEAQAEALRRMGEKLLPPQE